MSDTLVRNARLSASGNLTRVSRKLFPALVWLLASNVSAGSVVVSWSPNTEDDLAGYKVYYGTSSRQYDREVFVGNETSVRITGLRPSKRYYFAVTAFDFSGNESAFSEEVSTVVPEGGDDAPAEGEGGLQSVAYNFPNPFVPGREVTRIRYELSEPAEVTIEILDVNSRLVKIVVQEAFRAAGEHTRDVWDGTNEAGDPVANGVYYCRIRTRKNERSLKVAVLRGE